MYRTLVVCALMRAAHSLTTPPIRQMCAVQRRDGALVAAVDRHLASLERRRRGRRQLVRVSSAAQGGSEDGSNGYRRGLEALRRQITRLLVIFSTWLRESYQKVAASQRWRSSVRGVVLVSVCLAVYYMVKAKVLVGGAVSAPLVAGAELSDRATAAALPPSEVAWSTFIETLRQKKGVISEVVVSPSRYDFMLQGGEKYYTMPVAVASDVLDLMIKAGATVRAAPKSGLSLLTALTWIIMISYIAAVSGAARQMFRGGVGNVGRRAKMNGNSPDAVTFDMIAGIGEARREVEELRDLFASQQKYAKVGARAPKGVLLVGPPGTGKTPASLCTDSLVLRLAPLGKTMLARALATEANVPFVYCSGSDFVEIFAGRGAARVRQLFARAAKIAPCIIFIDELDALGKARRDMPSFGWNDESEQTLNQLLAAMDGVESNRGIVVLAATNRLSVLDNALVRPGRFDRIIQIPPPDLRGRAEILKIHVRGKPLAPDVDLESVAAATPGLVGADLAAICNEAAIRAIRNGRDIIQRIDISDAVDTFFKTRAAKRPSILPPLF